MSIPEKKKLIKRFLTNGIEGEISFTRQESYFKVNHKAHGKVVSRSKLKYIMNKIFSPELNEPELFTFDEGGVNVKERVLYFRSGDLIASDKKMTFGVEEAVEEVEIIREEGIYPLIKILNGNKPLGSLDFPITDDENLMRTDSFKIAEGCQYQLITRGKCVLKITGKRKTVNEDHQPSIVDPSTQFTSSSESSEMMTSNEERSDNLTTAEPTTTIEFSPPPSSLQTKLEKALSVLQQNHKRLKTICENQEIIKKKQICIINHQKKEVSQREQMKKSLSKIQQTVQNIIKGSSKRQIKEPRHPDAGLLDVDMAEVMAEEESMLSSRNEDVQNYVTWRKMKYGAYKIHPPCVESSSTLGKAPETRQLDGSGKGDNRQPEHSFQSPRARPEMENTSKEAAELPLPCGKNKNNTSSAEFPQSNTPEKRQNDAPKITQCVDDRQPDASLQRSSEKHATTMRTTTLTERQKSPPHGEHHQRRRSPGHSRKRNRSPASPRKGNRRLNDKVGKNYRNRSPSRHGHHRRSSHVRHRSICTLPCRHCKSRNHGDKKPNERRRKDERKGYKK